MTQQFILKFFKGLQDHNDTDGPVKENSNMFA